uniref:SAM domain-containing protein n=1 Tax=Alexandrium catenella TaxID=2925 RepID=A0A7S1PS12_ALECA|mmetsp:Transcript_107580/g.286290  ORF Transcript_107580/g.286290 Transcript_107580/m.286290 type:complete len:380 (+) Transcript_107580:112-1251(+)
MPAAADTAPFAGLWEDDAGGIITIQGTKATASSGDALEFAIVSRKKCALKVASKVAQGTLAADGSKIAWSNGSAWIRREDEASQQPANGINKAALEGPAAEEVGAWLRSIDGPKLVQYWPKLCQLVNGVKDIMDRYADRPKEFLTDLGVEHPGHRSAFSRALRQLREAEEPEPGPEDTAAAAGVAQSPSPPGAAPGWQRAPRTVAGRAEAQAEEADAAAGDSEGGLTLERVLRLQRELYVAFKDEDFQRRLAEVEAAHGTARANYSVAHTELFLTVQNTLLPKYGFSEGQKGVIEMLKSSARFNGNRQFQQNRAMLNQLLGLAPRRGEREQHLAEIAAQQEDRLPALPALPETLHSSVGIGLPATVAVGQPQAGSEPRE